MQDFLLQWQTLIGAFVGAATPLGIVLINRRFLERKDHLVKVYKMILLATTNALEVADSMDDFRNIRLTSILNFINLDRANERPSLGEAFFPPLARTPLGDAILEKHCGSDYVETQLIFALTTSKNFALLIDDAQKKFESLIQMQTTFVLQKYADHELLNNTFEMKTQLYRTYLKDYFFVNLQIYLKILAKTRVTTRVFMRLGGFRWRLLFEPNFRYFIGRKTMMAYTERTFKKIDLYLEKDIQDEYAGLLKQIKVQT